MFPALSHWILYEIPNIVFSFKNPFRESLSSKRRWVPSRHRPTKLPSLKTQGSGLRLPGAHLSGGLPSPAGAGGRSPPARPRSRPPAPGSPARGARARSPAITWRLVGARVSLQKPQVCGAPSSPSEEASRVPPRAPLLSIPPAAAPPSGLRPGAQVSPPPAPARRARGVPSARGPQRPAPLPPRVQPSSPPAPPSLRRARRGSPPARPLRLPPASAPHPLPTSCYF